jgi:hypothetical protein
MPPAEEVLRVRPEAQSLPPGHALYQMAMGHFVPPAFRQLRWTAGPRSDTAEFS